MNLSDRERYVYVEVGPDGPGALLDFSRMELRLREKGDRAWGVHAGDQVTALRHRSIRGFDESAFWRSLEASGAWEASVSPAEPPSPESVPLAEAQSLRMELRDGARWWRPKYQRGAPGQLKLLLNLLKPLSLDALWDVIAPVRCEFAFFEPVGKSGRRRGVRHSGTAAIRAIEELISIGVAEWAEASPEAQSDRWDEVEWESVENELKDGRPYVPPGDRPSECRRLNKHSEEWEWGYFSRPKPGVHIPPLQVWQLKVSRDSLRISQHGLVRDRVRVDVTVGCGVFDCCGLYWARSRRFTLLRRLLHSSYGETFVPPSFWSAQDNDFWSAQADGQAFAPRSFSSFQDKGIRSAPANYYYEVKPASYATRHNYWLNLPPVDPCSIVLEGRSEEEVFRYEFIRAQAPMDLLSLEASPRPPAVGFLRVNRRSLATGVVWTVERPLSSPCLDRLSDLLNLAGASSWTESPGWPDNAWHFTAQLHGKVYRCGGIAATGGGIESPEPDPRLAILRKILHFVG